jgi:hypothetical protein
MMEIIEAGTSDEAPPVTLADVEQLLPLIDYWSYMPVWKQKFIAWTCTVGKKTAIRILSVVIALLLTAGILLSLSPANPPGYAYIALGVALGVCLILLLFLV